MKALLLLALPLTALLIACGGGEASEDRVLHFTGRDETESNFRGRIREIAGSMPLGVQLICRQIRGLPPKEAVPLLDGGNSENQTFPGSTPKPGQVAKPKDLERSAEIIQEECARIFD